MSAAAMNDLAELDAAIVDMKEARESHEDWMLHLERGDCECCTPEVVRTAGDAAQHRVWIEKYDRVLAILLARRNALRSARRRSREGR